MTAEHEGLSRMALRGKRGRPPEDRIALRYPALATFVFAWFARAALRLPRGWRLRQRLNEYSAWRAFNAIGRGDLDVLRTINHREVIWDLSGWGWPEASVYRGRDGAVEFNRQWVAQWRWLNFDVASIEELDERGVFLIHVVLRGIGHTSGVEVTTDNFQIVRTRDGLVWRGAFYPSRAAALEAARSPVP